MHKWEETSHGEQEITPPRLDMCVTSYT
uniref:Uncharacterized protein n=1 Tax=Nelumbo nucifera TaxID=4432 RepID=A0A822YN53_NELNU|nr:TPA_asm: hypothetical protein HUJ06_012813 [Nelumbo nucifera]